MSNPVAHLEPKDLWARFNEICQIPRPSKHEAQIRQYVLDYAAQHGLETATDKLGNVVVRVPASPGLESAPTVILQGHLDMVCEKDAHTEHDFFKDPIRLVLEGDILHADGTTLGADNGVALAAGLGLVTDTAARHGPLELLFTLDEETGLTGARELDVSMLTGRVLVNLDSEEDGVITVGCAGGRDTEIQLPVTRAKAPAGAACVRIKAAGMHGGHSGVDIHQGRANALKVVAEVLKKAGDARLVALTGGNAHNAIPREAEAVVVGDVETIRRTAAAVEARRIKIHARNDPDLKITVDEATAGELPMTPESSRAVVDLVDRPAPRRAGHEPGVRRAGRDFLQPGGGQDHDGSRGCTHLQPELGAKGAGHDRGSHRGRGPGNSAPRPRPIPGTPAGSPTRIRPC